LYYLLLKNEKAAHVTITMRTINWKTAGHIWCNCYELATEILRNKICLASWMSRYKHSISWTLYGVGHCPLSEVYMIHTTFWELALHLSLGDWLLYW